VQTEPGCDNLMVCSWNKALPEIKIIIAICIMIISLDFVEKISVDRGFTRFEKAAL